MQEIEMKFSGQYTGWQLTEVELEEASDSVYVVIFCVGDEVDIALGVKSLSKAFDDSVRT